MTESIRIRAALPSESALLSDLALRAKAHWGYSREFLNSCRDELTVQPPQMYDDGYQCFVAERDNTMVGFYAVEAISTETYELGALFVEPQHIGSGAGRALLQHATWLLSRLGGARLTIQGDPNATGFYLAAGARQVGERESGSIPGRFLPLFEIDLAKR